MRLFYFSLVCFFALSNVLCAETILLPYKTDVVVDGTNQEWTSPLPRYDKTTTINYAVANDEKNLYIICRCVEESNQNLILQNGMDIWININGKKQKSTGINFPISKMEQTSDQANSNSTNRTDAPNGDDVFCFLKGFKIQNGKQNTKDCLIKASMDTDKSGCLVYELQIPFSTFYKENLDQSDLKTVLCLGFSIKGKRSRPKPSAQNNEIIDRYDDGYRRAGMNTLNSIGNAATNSFEEITMDKNFWISVKPALK